MHVQHEDYAYDPFLFYPGARLSADERRRMDTYEIKIDEVTVDHLVYAMSKQIENNFQTFYSVAEEIIGEEKALEIAHEIGRRYGGRGAPTRRQRPGPPGARGRRVLARVHEPR